MMDTSDEENEAVADTSALVPWTNQDSSDMEIYVNEPKLQDCIETENLSLVNSTINTSSNNVILQEEINQIETVLEFQHGNCEQLGIQHETLCADSGHETKMRENLLRMVDHSRQTSKLLEDALKRAAVAYDARVAGREYLSAATASAACALSASAARRVQREKAYRDELSSMQQEVNNLTKRKNELTDIAENLTKFEEERREEYARNFEKLNKEMENMESEGEELEKLNKELQKNLAEMDSQYMDLNMEIKTVQGEYESEKKELTEKILLQEKILTEQHKEKASLKARIASQEQLVKATTAECVSYEERLIILEESCNKTDVRPEEEEELVISLETRLRNLTALSNDNDQISKKQFQNIQDLLKKLTTIQEETRKIIDIRLAKELDEVDTVKRRDEKALLLDQLKEAKRKHHIKETLQRNIEHKKIGLLENISKAEIELTMLAENYELFYSNLIGEKNWKSEKLAFTVKRVEELDQKLGVAYCNLNIQKQINADHVSEIEKIDTQLTDIFLKNDRTLLEHSNIITTLKNGKEELQKKIEELNKLTGDSELMDTDLKLKLQSSIEEQESLHKEIACLKLEAQAKVEILEEINRNYQEKKIELEKQMNDQRLQHESKTSALLKENTEIEMRLDNENKTISKLVSEIKKNIDMKSTIEVDIENYHKEIKSVTDAITIKNTNLATAVKEKENDRKEKTKKNENVYRRLKKNTSENEYLQNKLDDQSRPDNVLEVDSG